MSKDCTSRLDPFKYLMGGYTLKMGCKGTDSSETLGVESSILYTLDLRLRLRNGPVRQQ